MPGQPPALVLVAVRHGESTLNAAGRLTGQLDPPLTARGRAQARALGPAIDGPFDRYLHSGARRAHDTLALALAAAGRPDAALEADPRWRERSFGALEGGPARAWVQPADDVDAAAPGGESYRALGLRVLAALQALVTGTSEPQRVLLCAHSGVLRMLGAIADGATTLAPVLAGEPAHAQAVELRYATIAAPPLLG